MILKGHCSHISGKPNGIIITEELREELNQAALATTQAYVGARNASAGNNVQTESFHVGVFESKGTFSLGMRHSFAAKSVSTGNNNVYGLSVFKTGTVCM